MLYLAVCAGHSGSELVLVQTTASRDMAQKTPRRLECTAAGESGFKGEI